MIGISDLGRELVDLLERFLFGLGAHPIERLDIRLIGFEQVRDQQVRFGLGLGRKIFRDIELAQRFADRSVEEMDAAGLAVELFGVSAQDLAVEIEIRVVETLGQIGGDVVEVMNREVIAPDRDRRFGKDLSELRESRLLRDDDHPLALGALERYVGLLEIDVPGEIGGQFQEIRDRHRIVGLGAVATVGAVPLDLGDLGFESEHCIRALFGIRRSNQRQHGREELLVGIARGDDRLVVLQVIVAVGHSEAGLIQVDGIGLGVLIVRFDVERIDAAGRETWGGHDPGDVGFGLEARDVLQILFGRLQPVLLDLSLVGEGIVEIAQLLLLGRQILVGLGFERSDDRLHGVLALDREIEERAGLRAVGGDFRRLEPLAVHIVEEVVARLDAWIDRGKVDAPVADSRLAAIRLGRGQDQAGGERHDRREDMRGLDHRYPPEFASNYIGYGPCGG